MLERIAEMAWKRLEAAKGAFEANEDFLSLAGCATDDLPGIMVSLGFGADTDGKWTPKSWRNRQNNNQKPRREAKPKTADADHKGEPKGKEDGTQNTKPHKPRHSQNGPQKGPQKGQPRGAHPGKGAPNRGPKRPTKPREPQMDPDSPFAKLKELKLKS